MMHFSAKEQPRPEFSGRWLRSPVHGKVEEFFPFWSQVCRIMFSQTVISMLAASVVGTVIGIFILRTFLARERHALGLSIAAVVNAIVIEIFNVVS
jgi:hypothetical protein